MSERKLLMMDAGTALFEMEGGFGTALGQVKAELREFGPVSEDGEDLVLDLGGAWSRRRVSCHLEGAGDNGEMHRYAAVFKEGSRNTRLKNIVHGTFSTVVAMAAVLINILRPEVPAAAIWISFLIVEILTACSWIRPDRKAAMTVDALIVKISGLK